MVANTSVSDCPETLALSGSSLVFAYFRNADGLDCILRDVGFAETPSRLNSAACSSLALFLGTITDTPSDLLKNEVLGAAWILGKFLLGAVTAGMLDELTEPVFDPTFGAVVVELPVEPTVLDFGPTFVITR